MKRALISLTAIFLVVFLAGCKVTKGPEAEAEDTSVARPDLAPFGLTLAWKVEDIPDDPAWKDVSYEDLRYPRQGILVKNALGDRQAAQKGFKGGEIIYAINKKRFKSTGEMMRILYRLEPGKGIPFHVVREEGGKKTLLVIDMVIPTYGYTDWNFPLVYGYHRNDYVKRMHVFYVLFFDRRCFSSRTTGILPFYYRERIGNISTHRIFWFFKWRTGVEDDIMI